MTDNALRFPAEWEPQSAVLLAWPNADTDWAERLGDVEETYIALVAAITRFEPALVCVADDDVEAYARARLSSARIDMGRDERHRRQQPRECFGRGAAHPPAPWRAGWRSTATTSVTIVSGTANESISYLLSSIKK